MMDGSKPEKYDAVPATASAYVDRHYCLGTRDLLKKSITNGSKTYSHFRDLILREIEPNALVLEVGCGNSQLCEDLYRDGITELTCIDLSPVAVEKMAQRLSSKGFKEIKVLEADMLELPFEDECFDVVIEKGTMDVLFVDSGGFILTKEKVMAMLQGVHFHHIWPGPKIITWIEPIEKINEPSITLFHEELDEEDYLFRTNVDGI